MVISVGTIHYGVDCTAQRPTYLNPNFILDRFQNQHNQLCLFIKTVVWREKTGKDTISKLICTKGNQTNSFRI